ncbi:hypothetical protein [Kitasatospora sp. DSM 101779]|uniref:hypothetical protein n=1 Tax=Kitasatospora sp. DSM 101779 TaxID=2853165 RepID=UPI0021D88453|nr:hypothetical protein [Kitasatospora sp. DSM 101779]MCU7827262.1 hypothetical protein [Kitasatospora sp. DSM 101779]
MALTTATVLLAGCSSTSKSGQLPAGVAELRQRLAAFEKPLGGDDAQRAWEGLAAAVDDATAQGTSQSILSREVLLWESGQLGTADGQKTFMANAAALNGRIVSVGVPSTPSAPPLGAGTTQGRVERPAVYRQAPNGGGLSFYFVNGVLNNFDSSTVGAGLLSTTLSQQLGYPVNVHLQFNASSASIAAYTYSACQEAQRVTADNPIPENQDLVKGICRLSAAGAAVLPEAVIADVSQVIGQKVADPDFASDPVNVSLLQHVRDDLSKGLRVVLISHSQGGLFLRNVLPRIGSGKPVGALYIAPPFGSGQELNSNPTRYVMFEWDWLLAGISSVDPTVKAAPPQTVYDGSAGSRLNIHYLSNYLYCGSDSAKQVGDRTRELVDYVNSVPSRVGPPPELRTSSGLPGSAAPVALGGDGLLPVQASASCVAPPQSPSESQSSQSPSAPSESPSAPSESPSATTESPSAPSESPSTPSESPSATTETPSSPAGTPTTPTQTPPGTPSASAIQYYVFLLTNVSGGNVLVGTLQDVMGKRTCDFVDGGLCADAGGADVPVQYVAKLGPYPTLTDAQAAFCAAATNQRPGPPAAGGTKVDIFGGSYWIDNISFTCPS